MSNAKRRKKSLLQSRFYQVYFAVLAVAVVLIAAGTIWLNGYVKDFEAAQPIHVARQVAELFEAGDYARVYELDSAAQDVFGGDRDYYVESLTEAAAGRALAWGEVLSSSEDEHKYNVTLDQERFATFTLVPTGARTRRGFRHWGLGTLTTLVEVAPAEPEIPEEDETDAQATAEPEAEPVAYRITAPSDCRVTFEGRVLTGEDVVNASVPTLPEGFLPEGLSAPTLVEYEAVSTSPQPDVAVADASGQPRALRHDDATTYFCGVAENEEFKAAYGQDLIKLAKRLARFTSNDLTQKEILTYCEKGSPIYDIIQAFDNAWAMKHSGIDFKNEVVEDVVFHSEACFTCRVSFDFTLYAKGQPKTSPTTYTLCLVNTAKGPKLYNWALQN